MARSQVRSELPHKDNYVMGAGAQLFNYLITLGAAALLALLIIPPMYMLFGQVIGEWVTPLAWSLWWIITVGVLFDRCFYVSPTNSASLMIDLLRAKATSDDAFNRHWVLPEGFWCVGLFIREERTVNLGDASIIVTDDGGTPTKDALFFYKVQIFFAPSVRLLPLFEKLLEKAGVLVGKVSGAVQSLVSEWVERIETEEARQRFDRIVTTIVRELGTNPELLNGVCITEGQALQPDRDPVEQEARSKERRARIFMGLGRELQEEAEKSGKPMATDDALSLVLTAAGEARYDRDLKEIKFRFEGDEKVVGRIADVLQSPAGQKAAAALAAQSGGKKKGK